MKNEDNKEKDSNESICLSKEEEELKSQRNKTKTRRHSSLSVYSSNKNDSKEKLSLSSHVIYFGCEQHLGIELWDTSYFLSILFELLDDFKNSSNEESRLVAFMICHINEINLNSLIPIKLIIKILKYFNNIRLKILILLELLNVCETIDCTQALILLWEFSTYGYMTLFYVLDRIKFTIIDKDIEWKSLLTIFEPIENKKHAAYIVLDKTNFYKPNRAVIVFGSKRLKLEKLLVGIGDAWTSDDEGGSVGTNDHCSNAYPLVAAKILNWEGKNLARGGSRLRKYQHN